MSFGEDYERVVFSGQSKVVSRSEFKTKGLCPVFVKSQTTETV